MEIRIPLKSIIAGDYKVGLTPHSLTTSIIQTEGWVKYDGTFYPLLPREMHVNAAERIGLVAKWPMLSGPQVMKAAFATGALRIKRISHAGGFGIEAGQAADKNLMIQTIERFPTEMAEVEYQEGGNLNWFRGTQSQVQHWLKTGQQPSDVAKFHAMAAEASIYKNGGWIDTKGEVHVLARYSDLHDELAEKLGYEGTLEAIEAGYIRVGVFSTDYFLEFQGLNPTTRAHVIDFLQAANSGMGVVVEWWDASKRISRDFDNPEQAIDYLENRRVFASDKTASLDSDGWILSDGKFEKNFSGESHPWSAHRLKLDTGSSERNIADFSRPDAVRQGNIRVSVSPDYKWTYFDAHANDERTQTLLLKALDQVLTTAVSIDFNNGGGIDDVTPNQAAAWLQTGNKPSEAARFHAAKAKLTQATAKKPVKKKGPRINLDIFDNDFGGFILPDGSMEEVTEEEGLENGHNDLAIRLGHGDERSALIHGLIRVDLASGHNGFGYSTLFEVEKLDDNTRRLIEENLHYARTKSVEVEWWQPSHKYEAFNSKEDALEWFEGRTVFASKFAAVLSDFELIKASLMAGLEEWGAPKHPGSYAKLKPVAKKYGVKLVPPSKGADSGLIWGEPEIIRFDADQTNVEDEFFAGGNTDFDYCFDPYHPEKGVIIDQNTNLLTDSTVRASDGKVYICDNTDVPQIIVLTPGAADPQIKQKREIENRKKNEKANNYYMKPEDSLTLKDGLYRVYNGYGTTSFSSPSKEKAVAYLNQKKTGSKVAISLPKLVQETNSFSVKNRPGCSATLKNSNPGDLYLEYNVKCNLPDSDPSGHDVRVHFDVSKVEETEKAKDLDVRVSCACPAFLYWGGQWNLHQRDGLEGQPRPKLQAPTERLDLRSNFVICKHCKAVFERILPAVQNNINTILRKLQVKKYEEEVQEKGIQPPTIRRQPGQLSPEDKDVAQKLREGIEQREREKILKDQGIVKRTPEVVETAPKKPSEEPLEELEPYLPEREFDELKDLEEGERKKLLEGMPAPPTAPEAEPGRIEEHPDKPHLHKGLPYERKEEEPKWKQWVNKLKERVKNWKGKEEKPPYRKFTNRRVSKSLLLQKFAAKEQEGLDFQRDGWLTKDGKYILANGSHAVTAWHHQLVTEKVNYDAEETLVGKAMDNGHIRVISTGKNGKYLYLDAAKLDSNTVGLLRKAFSEGKFSPSLTDVNITWYTGSKEFNSPEEARDWVDNL